MLRGSAPRRFRFYVGAYPQQRHIEISDSPFGSVRRTAEGIAPSPGQLSVLQDAFCESHGLQCGFCTPGMILAGHALLTRTSSPTRSEIVEALSGNLCRCTGYVQIIEAIELAAQRLRQANTLPFQPER